ncbi:hypothetical protein ONZ45_g16166 [Pleurotus djamor]|nr:hypothetical protein ONZ45_g16166 [Pleurotus djamor]
MGRKRLYHSAAEISQAKKAKDQRYYQKHRHAILTKSRESRNITKKSAPTVGDILNDQGELFGSVPCVPDGPVALAATTFVQAHESFEAMMGPQGNTVEFLSTLAETCVSTGSTSPVRELRISLSEQHRYIDDRLTTSELPAELKWVGDTVRGRCRTLLGYVDEILELHAAGGGDWQPNDEIEHLLSNDVQVAEVDELYLAVSEAANQRYMSSDDPTGEWVPLKEEFLRENIRLEAQNNSRVDVPKTRYAAFSRMMHQYSHIKMCKRSGLGNIEDGLSKAGPGDLALTCLACPYPDTLGCRA